MSHTAAMKLTLTQGLLVLLVATQIPVAIHYGRPLVDQLIIDMRLKREQDERWKRVLKLAEIHCTDQARIKTMHDWDPSLPPETRETCLSRMGEIVRGEEMEKSGSVQRPLNPSLIEF